MGCVDALILPLLQILVSECVDGSLRCIGK
jgi:hypothetical protein